MDQPHEPGTRATACTTVRSCRSCGREDLHRVLDLGRVPLANALLERPEVDEQRYPLTLAFCPGCSLVQILETVDPEVLFGHYLYFSSFSKAMLAHAKAEAEMLIKRRGLNHRSLVVEVASNDGYLLRNFVDRGIGVLGVEPARNIAQVAINNGVPTRCAFFGQRYAEDLRREGLAADCVLGNNVLAHVADLNGFVRGAAALLKPDGVCVFEFPYLGDMIEHLEFDTIYHEHLCYFSLHAIDALFARHGLRLVDVERLSVHGGSLRVFGEPTPAGTPRSERVSALLEHERASGMTGPGYYARFAERVRGVVRDLVTELEGRRARGQRLAAYGASAKGSTLMNYAGIDARHLEYVCDLSTAKQGRYTPGNHLPIVSPDRLNEPTARPDAVLLLSWNWAREIAEQQSAYLNTGGEFIVPIPSVRSLRSGDVSALGVIAGPSAVGSRS
jgi:SAM-dependent methyltransferase